MQKIKLPSIQNVAEELQGLKQWIEGEEAYIEVRLQVSDLGTWAVLSGDSQYDTDHRGYWGASELVRRSNCRETARDLIDQVSEDIAMNPAK